MNDLMSALQQDGGSRMLMVVSGEDLKEFARQLITFAKSELKAQNEPEYYTRKELSERLHVSTVTIYRYERDGILKSHKINGRVLYDKRELKDIGSGKRYAHNRAINK